ncbi:hypothetical protein [Anaeroselena agilis]|uniref:Terminase n=1 Tax=Anaeroselena agilis TaxID=3063788 RepID=A0ABU3NVS6_9FIRM|nr:hypothetical protein [Selenomonadales bacterium 4137-cl]
MTVFDEQRMVDEAVAAMELAMESVVNFRRIYLPGVDERPPAFFHYEWDRILLHGNKHFAIEAFRECGKSSIIRAFLLHRLMFPTLACDYIILILATQRKASQRLKEIADEYLSNPIFKHNLIEVKEQSQNAFCVLVKDLWGNPIEIRLEAYGKGASIRGAVYKDKRPRLLILDDPQDTEDAKSDTVQDNDWEWFLSDVKFLGENCRIFVIGNNLGAACLIEQIFLNKDRLGFETKRIPIMKDGVPTWPERHSIENILAERTAYEEMGKIDVWFREKMCEAIAPGSQIFREDMIKFYDPKKINLGELSIYITIDLAISQRKEADNTVILVTGVNSQNHWFVIDGAVGHFSPTETIEHIFRLVSRYGIKIVGLEKVGYQAALEDFINKEMQERNIWFRVEPLRAEGKKEERIRMLQPRFTVGTIWFSPTLPWFNIFKAEFLSFPKGLHDDVLDTLAYVEQIAKAPSRSAVKRKPGSIPLAGSM